jgi:hypothetical protein
LVVDDWMDGSVEREQHFSYYIVLDTPSGEPHDTRRLP